MSYTHYFKQQCRMDDLIFISIIHTLYEMSAYVSLIVYALYLNQYMGVVQTAFIVALPSFIGFLSGPIPYMITQKFGMKKTIISCFISLSFSYFFLSIIQEFVYFFIISILIGVTQLILKPILKSLFSECAYNETGIDFVHRMRYISICISGIIGPIIGGKISQYYGFSLCFQLSSFLFFICVLSFIFWKRNKNDNTALEKNSTIQKNDRIFYIDRKNRYKLFLCILSGMIVYSVFIQFESVYSLALKELFDNPEDVYSKLIALNSFLGLLLQIIIMYSRERIKKYLKVQIGLLFFQMAFFMFALIFYWKSTNILVFIFAIYIYTMGESIAIPALDITIDKIAPADKKNLYFGFAELRGIGFSIGPLLMGIILEYVGTISMNMINVFLLFTAMIIEFYLDKKLKNEC